MALPVFFIETAIPEDGVITLPEDVSRHVAQVLRMKAGEQIELTDGKGRLLTTQIIDDHKKHSKARLLSVVNHQPASRRVSIAISLIKNTNRFEWFLEKATEIGVNEIFPLICERTEKQQFRSDRMRNILISAMLQSRQVWLPELHDTLSVPNYIKETDHPQKFLAHCLNQEKRLLREIVNREKDALVLIGPEGDFTNEEVHLAINNNFMPVSLGETRLRTETAGVVAATLIK